MRPPLRSSLVVVFSAATIAGLGACHSWTRHDLSPGSATTIAGGHPVRVTRRDNAQFTLRRAHVEGDSLVGELVTDDAAASAERSATAVSDVLRVEERRVSALRTGGLVLGTTLLVGGILVVAATIALLSSWN